MGFFGLFGKDKITVLHVDDSGVILMQSRKLLIDEFGFDVLSAKNGQDGVNIAKKEKPDLILMDCTMPIMDGFQALEAIKGAPETKDIPVIMCTALSAVKDIDRAEGMGSAGYIIKPFTKDSLGAKIKEELIKSGKIKAEDFKGGAPAPKEAAPAPKEAAPAPKSAAALPPAKSSALPPAKTAAPAKPASVAPAAAPSKQPCPKCKADLAYIEQYKAWYCNACKAYPYAQQASKKCKLCNGEATFVQQYNALYCYACKKYPDNPG